MSDSNCRLCGGLCAGTEMDRLLSPELLWLWESIAAAADRRGDPEMVSGPSVTVTAPDDPAQRAAAAGLFPRALAGGATLRLNLDDLTGKIRVRGDSLTPGAVAAHAVGRELARNAAARAARRDRAQRLLGGISVSADRHPVLEGSGPALFEHLRKSGWISRLDNQPDARELTEEAVDVAAAVMGLPEGERVDRRMLVPNHPHALDEGTLLAGLVLSLLAAAGKIVYDRAASSRSLWGQAGVDCDRIVGGLTTLGIHPAGWSLPDAAVCTIPPRELVSVQWPTAEPAGAWVFVTENPSIMAAAADMVCAGGYSAVGVRLICTVGNPSAVEIAALSRLADRGWRIAVRADFDGAGLRTVNAVINATETAVPWRMCVADYRDSDPRVGLGGDPIPSTPWDPQLAEEIAEVGCAAFEEFLTDELLADLRAGSPHNHIEHMFDNSCTNPYSRTPR